MVLVVCQAMPIGLGLDKEWNKGKSFDQQAEVDIFFLSQVGRRQPKRWLTWCLSLRPIVGR